MGDHEMSTVNGKQSPPDPSQTEPPAETPLTVASSKTPQNEPPPDATENNEHQTENVPPKKAWWRKWKGAIISVAVVLLILALIASGVFLVSWLLDKPKKNEEFAAYYEKSLDQKILPCDNFYKFACTNLRREYAKENKDRFDTMAMMTKSARHSLNDLLTKPLNTSDSPMLREIKTFHQMCINTTKVEVEGIKPVLDLLREIGGWPLLSRDWKSTEGWEDIVASINRVGFLSIFPFHLNPGLGLRLAPLFNHERSGVLPDEKRTVEYVKRVARLLNATNDELDDDIKECIVFESKIQEITNSAVPNREVLTIQSLMTDYTKVLWIPFFRGVLFSTGMEVSSNTTVLFTHSNYTSKVMELLGKTSVKVIRNYIVWRLIEQAIPVLPEKFREAKNDFEQRAVGPSRNDDCVEILITRVELSIADIYINNYFDGSARNTSGAILESIKKQANVFLKNNTWMDIGTKTNMSKTMEELIMILPPTNNSVVEMENFEFHSNDTMFVNYVHLAKSHRDSKYARLERTLEQDQRAVPLQYAMHADAYYAPSWNTMIMLAAMFQRPVFHVEQPMYLNYGGIGFVMAHEMTHALQILSVCNNDTCPSYSAFQDRKNCMVDLYDKYVLEQISEKVNGTKTAEENIGDFIGLKLAYQAYEQYMNGSEESSLPGLNYTTRQWFWINVASFFCSFETDAGLRKYMADEVHSPAEARVNVAFANTEQFSIDFACANNTRMNATRKCQFE